MTFLYVLLVLVVLGFSVYYVYTKYSEYKQTQELVYNITGGFIAIYSKSILYPVKSFQLVNIGDNFAYINNVDFTVIGNDKDKGYILDTLRAQVNKQTMNAGETLTIYPPQTDDDYLLRVTVNSGHDNKDNPNNLDTGFMYRVSLLVSKNDYKDISPKEMSRITKSYYNQL